MIVELTVAGVCLFGAGFSWLIHKITEDAPGPLPSATYSMF